MILRSGSREKSVVTKESLIKSKIRRDSLNRNHYILRRIRSRRFNISEGLMEASL